MQGRSHGGVGLTAGVMLIPHLPVAIKMDCHSFSSTSQKMPRLQLRGLPIGIYAILLAVIASMGGFIFGYLRLDKSTYE